MSDPSNPRSSVPFAAGSPSEAEFEKFVTAIGWHSSYRRGQIAAGAVPPEQEAPANQRVPERSEPSPARPQVPPVAAKRSKGPVLRLLLATVLVVGVVLWRPLEAAVTGAWAHFSGRSQQEFNAQALLLHAQFTMALRPGMSAEEVRDRVGLPGSRSSGAPFGAEQAWYYTTNPGEREGQARTYVVAIDEGKVVRSLEITQLRSLGQVPDIRRTSPQYLGDLRANNEGKGRVLRSSADTAVLLLGTSANLTTLPGSGIRIMEPERVIVAKTGAAVELPPVSVYWHGVLFPLASSTGDIPSSVLADDVNWLLESLGCDGKGKMLFPAKAAPSVAR